MKALTTTTAPDLVRDARQLYQSYRDTANRESKLKNLDLLWEVLEAIREEGGRDYSLAEVGRRLEAAGGPKTQSLRNVQGAHFRDVITAYADAVSGSKKYVAKGGSQVEAALELITDPSIRATLRMAIEEGKRLKVVNDNLHAAFKTLQVGAVGTAVAEVPQIAAPVTSVEPLPAKLLRALKKGMDRTRLAERGMQVLEDGSIRDEHGDVLFPPAFATAIDSMFAAGAA
jgi:hypothetical protein